MASKNYFAGVYKSLTKSTTFIGDVPHVLTKQAFNRGVLTRNNYSVTDKSDDGQRYLLHIDVHGLFSFITRKMDFILIPMAQPRPDYAGTLIDGEYINNTFYTTDILYSKGKDVREKFLDKRLDILFDILMGLRLNLLRMKISFLQRDAGAIYEYPGNKLTKFKSIYEASKSIKPQYALGGMIFTPVDPTKDSFIWNINTFNLKNGPPGNQFVLPTALQNYFVNRDTLEKLLLDVRKSLTPGGIFMGRTLVYKGSPNKKLKLLGQKEVDFKKFTQIMEKWGFKLGETRESNNGATLHFVFKKN